MGKTNSELKLLAKENLSGNWGIAIAACVITWLLTAAFTGNGTKDNTQLENIMSLLSLFLTGPMNFGLSNVFLKIVRSEPTQFNDLFAGFSFFLKTFLLHVVKYIFVLLWLLLFIIPGIIAIFRYSMAYYIMVDNPEISALEAIRQSKEMMAGHKLRLFSLWLSFIGWFLLGIFTFGLGLLYAMPYYEAAKANFYEDLITMQETAP
ncbi:MAG: DUF975 family protein [Clostridia bacterium]|nr:DUF975 family protein [Clostridia bacterium]